MNKPIAKLVGKDGNVFGIIGEMCIQMKRQGFAVEANEFREKAFAAKSYDEVLALCTDYADIR